MPEGCKGKNTSTEECDKSKPILTDINETDITDFLINDPKLSIFKINNEFIREYYKCGSDGSSSKQDSTCEALKKREVKRSQNVNPKILGEIDEIIKEAIGVTRKHNETIQELNSRLDAVNSSDKAEKEQGKAKISADFQKALKDFDEKKTKIDIKLREKLPTIRQMAQSRDMGADELESTPPRDGLSTNILVNLVELSKQVETLSSIGENLGGPLGGPHGGGKRKRRNSQKKKKNKSNRKKQRKSKASRKKKRN